jgi:PAS domain S-box-containing protein
LLGVHASGGIGRIWTARDNQFGRDVALKVLRREKSDDAHHRTRFLREARITGQLEHPGIVPVYEFLPEPENRLPLYTMRFIKGRTLSAAAREYHAKRTAGSDDPLGFVTLLNALVTACNTIAYAHSHNVIHRDLKGANVILGDFGEVIVLDWGLAKRLDSQEDSTDAEDFPPDGLDDAELEETVYGDVIGTPAYMAPEQAAGRLDLIDHRVDIFGLGAMLYEILTGEAPFGDKQLMQAIRKSQRGVIVPPHRFWPEVPPALEAACLRALAREPADRFAVASDLAREVQIWQETERRKAEEALRRQSQILKSILDSMSEAVIVADEQGRLLLVNPAANRMTGLEESDGTIANGLRRYHVFGPDQTTPISPENSPLARAIRGEQVDDAELFIRLPQQPREVWASANARPLRDENDTIRGGLVVVRDVTERTRAEHELERSRERFELAIRGSQDGLWDWDLETNETYFSPRWKSILGYEDHELRNHIEEWEARLHPDERENVLAANYAHIGGETPFYEYEYRLRHKDGSYRWILARGVALRRADGTAYRMAGSHVDVTERNEALAALRESEERYRSVIAAMRDGILLLDRDGTVRDCNASAERILGLSAEQMMGRSIFDAFLEPVQEDGSPYPLNHRPAMTTVRTGQAVHDALMGIQRPGGKLTWISVSAQPLRTGPEVQHFGVMVSFEDVTERKCGDGESAFAARSQTPQ